MSISSRRIVLGIITVLLVCGTLIGLEAIVRRKQPQRVYRQARASSMPIFAKSAYMVFTTKPNTNAEFSGYTQEFSSRVSINSLGLRGKEVSKEKPAGTYRILVTGDSMVFGWGVNDHETFAARLEELLSQKNTSRRYEVLNAGFTSGNGPASAYLYLKHYGMALQPDLVLVTIFPHNDLGDLGDEMWEKREDKRDKKNEGDLGLPGRVISKVTRVDEGYLVAREQPLRYRFPILRNTHLWQLIIGYLETRGVVKNPTGRDYSKPACTDLPACSKAYQRYQTLLSGFSQLARDHNIPLVLVFLPGPWQVEQGANLVRSYHQNEYYSGTLSARLYDNGLRLGNFDPERTLGKKAQEGGFMVLDLLPDLVHRDWKEYFYGSDGHLTRTGHQRVAEALLTDLLISRIALW